MRRTLTASLVLALGTLGPASAAAAPSANVTLPAAAADAALEHQRIVEFWTPERRATAVPRDLVLPGQALKPQGAAGKPGGGGSGQVTGATWSQGGSVVLTTGKLFFTAGGSRFTCSGSAVQSSAGNVVLTAGHCVHDGGNGAFVTNWIFYPGWNGAPHAALGAWTATDLFTTSGWATGSTSFDDDAGFAVVVGDPAKGSLSDAITAAGGRVPGIAFGTSAGNYSAFGYPASKKYKGNTLTYCAGPARERYDGHNTLALACDMTGGSSGGPWLKPFSNGTTTTDAINSLNSYGYASVSNTMFGPIFDAAEQNTYGAATLGDCPVVTSAAYRCVDYSSGA